MTERVALVRCEAVSRSYRTETEDVEAIRECSAQLYPGEVTVIAGPSGSGKSTLLRILAGIESPTTGTVWIGGRRVEALSARGRLRLRRELVSYVFQKPSDNFVSFFSVAEHLRICGVRERGAQATVLRRVGLEDRIDEVPVTLSGGEQQRAAFAQAMAAQRAIVAADEPTAELDHASAEHVLRAIETLSRSGACVLVASHDERVMAAADSTIRLRDGRIVPPWEDGE